MTLSLLGGILALLILAGGVFQFIKRNYPLSLLLLSIILIPAFEQYDNDYAIIDASAGVFRFAELSLVFISLCWMMYSGSKDSSERHNTKSKKTIL
jgi:hypothetical protein